MFFYVSSDRTWIEIFIYYLEQVGIICIVRHKDARSQTNV